MNLSPDQLRNLAEIIGARDHGALGAELEKILSGYELRRRGGRDTFPTVDQAHQTCIEIEKRLEWIFDELLGPDKNPFVAIWLSGALTGNDKDALLEFPEGIVQLLNAVRHVNADFARNADKPFEVSGELHHRKTRTKARDTVLIPALILCAQAYGDPDLVGDDTAYETWDTICEFLAETMRVAGIPSPDAGDTLRGEVAQGRLRRMVKGNIKRFRAMRENDA